MSKLKKDELLEWFKDLYSAANTYGWGGDKDEQAYQQIKETIQNQPEVTEEFVWKARDYIAEYPSYHRLEKKLKEAGVKIIK